MRFLFVGVILFCFVPQTFAQTINSTITVGGEERTYILYVPQNYNPEVATAVVFNFHGLGGDGSQQMSMSGMNTIADRENIIVVYPDGLENRWDISGSVDVDFVLSILDYIEGEYNVDKRRVYSMGMSMGGMISYHLACRASHRIAAIASVTGAMFSTRGCNPQRAVPILQIHGTDDEVVSYSLMETILDFWPENNGCQTGPVETRLHDDIVETLHTDCTNNADVVLLSMENAGHIWPRTGGFWSTSSIDASETAWDFFSTILHPDFDSLTSIKVTNQFRVSIGPNPIVNTLNVRLNNFINNTPEYVDIEIHNRVGERVFNKTIEISDNNSIEKTICVESLVQGVYFLSIDTKNESKQRVVFTKVDGE